MYTLPTKKKEGTRQYLLAQAVVCYQGSAQSHGLLASIRGRSVEPNAVSGCTTAPESGGRNGTAMARLKAANFVES